MVNKVILIGRLGRDPETRTTPGGVSVANFTIATDETFKDRSGERQKHTEWHRIVAWGKVGEIAQQYLKKGMLVYLEGKIQTREWEDKKDGLKKSTTEINISTVRMLEAREEQRTAAAPRSQQRPQPAQRPAPAQSEIDDSDIPF
jgi:single-strand DNA-binding protein